MTSIPFDYILQMNEDTVISMRNVVAQRILDLHGVKGLVTLWACQHFYSSSEYRGVPIIPVSEWWLASENTYANIVIKEISELPNKKALALLGIATRPPRMPLDVSVNKKNTHPILFAPPKEEYEYVSNVTASTVQKLAHAFFPHYPEFLGPQCVLYLAVAGYNDGNGGINNVQAVHIETLQAFADDGHALQYLLRVHEDPDISREYVTPEMEVLLSNTDAEWALFDSMGVDAEEAYKLITNKNADTLNIFLPEEFLHAVPKP